MFSSFAPNANLEKFSLGEIRGGKLSTLLSIVCHIEHECCIHQLTGADDAVQTFNNEQKTSQPTDQPTEPT